MSSVEPSFVKQTPVVRLTEHLRKCDFDELKIWFINGGHTIGQYILPAIDSALRSNAREFGSAGMVTAKVMLVDSALIPGSTLPERLNSPEKQTDFDDRLLESGYFTRRGQHHELVKETIQSFEKLDTRYENFSVEFRLTHQIPAGRILLAGKYGFFSPFIQEFNADLPVLVFDDKSPFFETSERYFDEVYTDEEQSRPVDLSSI